MSSSKEEKEADSGDASSFPFNKIERIISKGGKLNIQQRHTGIPGTVRSMLHRLNCFNTVNLLGWNWWYFHGFFLALYVVSMTLFALLYYFVIYRRNARIHLVDAGYNPVNLKPCLINVESFADCFLFSVDTQTTIGPGVRVPADHCPEIVLLVTIQSLWGVILNVVFTGTLLGRLAKPPQSHKRHHYAKGIIFSRFAAITSRNKQLYLTFRVGETRENVVERGVNVSVSCIQTVVTEEGEIIPLHCRDIKVGCEKDGSNSAIPLMWPIVVSHRIDKNSPLYEYDRIELQKVKLEIYVRLWGTIQGNLISVRTSYIPSEILWGYRFRPALIRDEDGFLRSVSHKTINAMETDGSETKSAKQLDQDRDSNSNTACNEALKACIENCKTEILLKNSALELN